MLHRLKLGRLMNVQYVISQEFKIVDDPAHALGVVTHDGIDIAPVRSKLVKSRPVAIAPYRGWIIDYGRDYPYWGNWVEMEHMVQGSAEPFWTRYYHLADLSGVFDSWTEKGEAVGIVGDSGDATGVHLHFGLYIMRNRKKIAVDPVPFLPWFDETNWRG